MIIIKISIFDCFLQLQGPKRRQPTMMKAASFRIDTMPMWQIIVIGVAACLILLGSLLLGFVGPNTIEETYWYAYDCPDNSHVWADNCTGIQMAEVFVMQDFLLCDDKSLARTGYKKCRNWERLTGFGSFLLPRTTSSMRMVHL